MSGSANEKPKPQITIDLDELGGRPDDITGDKEFLHSDAFDRVLEIIGKPPPSGQSDAARRYEPARRPASLDVLEDRKHDAVMISARRGEGKTTLLVSLMRSLQDGTYKKRPKHEGAAALYSLGLIDPTLIESKQNVIIAVVSRISDAVLHHRENCQHHRSHDEEFETTKKAMRCLANGLKLLDGVGDDKLHGGVEWDDADYIMDEGLRKASAAYALERNLREYVCQAAQYLKVDAFVLAIDDADTLFERGWPVLEALRKYLTIPKLRIVISGDIELFTELVRRKQWEQVGKDFLNAEARLAKARDEKSRIRELGYRVGELQDQYLVKLLPPERRIVLKSLTAKSRQANIVLKFTPSGEGKEKVEIGIDEFAKRFANLLMGLRSKEAVDLIKNRLLELPTRSAVQLLSGVAPLVGENKYSIEHAEAALDRIRHVATSALIDCRLSAEDTRDPIADPLLPRLSEWLTYSVKWSSFSRFYPDAVDDDEGNLTQLFLGALLNHVFIVNPGKMIEYWLRIAMVRVWLDQGNFPDGETDPDKAAEALDRWMDVKAQDTTLQYVSKFSAYMAPNLEYKKNTPGIKMFDASVPARRIRGLKAAFYTLYNKYYNDEKNSLNRDLFKNFYSWAGPEQPPGEKSFQALYDNSNCPYLMRHWHRTIIINKWNYSMGSYTANKGYFVNSIENLSNQINRKQVFLIPFMNVVNAQSSSMGKYSFLRMLSVVQDFIEIASEKNPSDLDLRLQAIFERASMIRSYPVPQFRGSSSNFDGENADQTDDILENSIDDNDQDDQTDEISDRNDPAIAAFKQWITHHQENTLKGFTGISPLVLSRIWTRFSYTFDSISENLEFHRSRYLGVVFHRTIIAFLHAVGVECLRANDKSPAASIWANPVTSGAVFVKLLEHIDGVKETPEGRFFYFLLSCPLWGFFLARTEADEVEEMRPGNPNAKIFEYYQKLVINNYKEPVDTLEFEQKIWKIEVKEPRRDGNSANFEGFFHILNTVYMQWNEKNKKYTINDTRNTLKRKRGGTDSNSPPTPATA